MQRVAGRARWGERAGEDGETESVAGEVEGAVVVEGEETGAVEGEETGAVAGAGAAPLQGEVLEAGQQWQGGVSRNLQSWAGGLVSCHSCSVTEEETCLLKFVCASQTLTSWLRKI